MILPEVSIATQRSIVFSIEDQEILFPVCSGSGDYSTGDSFSFSDLNGDLNGGDYKITLISMNATW